MPRFLTTCLLVTPLLTAISLHPPRPPSSDPRLHGKISILSEGPQRGKSATHRHSVHCRDWERDTYEEIPRIAPPWTAEYLGPVPGLSKGSRDSSSQFNPLHFFLQFIYRMIRTDIVPKKLGGFSQNMFHRFFLTPSPVVIISHKNLWCLPYMLSSDGCR